MSSKLVFLVELRQPVGDRPKGTLIKATLDDLAKAKIDGGAYYVRGTYTDGTKSELAQPEPAAPAEPTLLDTVPPAPEKPAESAPQPPTAGVTQP